MSKIKTISVLNLKAVKNLTGNFDGHTAIITGANDKGKSSFLKTTIQRIQGIKPSIVLNTEEKDGFGKVTLTDGCRFEWTFTDAGKEKLVYITEKEIKTAATREICDRYFPSTFDVDKFLLAQPMAQRKTLQILVGLDFTDIDARYKTAYDARTGANRARDEAKIKFEALPVPAHVEAVDVFALLTEKENIRKQLNDLYVENKGKNDKARTNWQTEVDKIKNDHKNNCDNLREEIQSHNLKVSNSTIDYNRCYDALSILKNAGYSGDAEIFLNDMKAALEQQKQYIEPEMPQLPVEPEYILELPDNAPLLAIDEKINTANETNRQALLYNDWLNSKTQLQTLVDAAVTAAKAVGVIEQERMDLIKSATLPDGFSFTDEGILYNNLPFTREQQSSSGIYIAALKLASMTLGEVKTLCFDASYLDNKNLSEIEKWASGQGLQLLIEQPCREGGEISYEIINDEAL